VEAGGNTFPHVAPAAVIKRPEDMSRDEKWQVGCCFLNKRGRYEVQFLVSFTI
jgi:hypothetical protein